MKVCLKCNQELDESQFGKDKNRMDGLKPYCRNCRKVESKEYNENKKSLDLKLRQQEKNKLFNEKLIKCTCCQQIKNLKEFGKDKFHRDGYNNLCKTCINNKRHTYVQKNKEKLNKYQSTYRKLNRIKVSIWEKNYRINNKEKYKKIYNNYRKDKRKNDINFKILTNLRSRLNSAIRRNSKRGHTIELLGCSIEFLKQHLENQFTDEMNWNNYGKVWEIDHIIPCIIFDLSLENQQKTCFHYSNLRPLECKLNRGRTKERKKDLLNK